MQGFLTIQGQEACGGVRDSWGSGSSGLAGVELERGGAFAPVMGKIPDLLLGVRRIPSKIDGISSKVKAEGVSETSRPEVSCSRIPSATTSKVC